MNYSTYQAAVFEGVRNEGRVAESKENHQRQHLHFSCFFFIVRKVKYARTFLYLDLQECTEIRPSFIKI